MNIDSIIKKYLRANNLPDEQGAFLKKISEHAPKTGSIAYPGSGEDVFHPILMGGDEILMIENNYFDNSVNYLHQELSELGVRTGAIRREERQYIIPLETGQKMVIMPADAESAINSRENYTGLLLKGSGKFERGRTGPSIAERFLERVTPEGMIIAGTRSYITEDLDQLATGELRTEFLSGAEVFSEHGIYRKNQE